MTLVTLKVPLYRAPNFITVRNEVAKVMFLHMYVFHRGEYLGRYPRGAGSPPGPGTHPQTRYTHPRD